MPRREGLTLDFDGEFLRDVALKAPMAAYRHLRGYLYGSMIEHRIAWIRRRKPRMKVGRIGERVNGRFAVGYTVPPDKVAASPADAVDKLERFFGEAYTNSVVLPVHEFGARITSRGKLMVIPIASSVRSKRAPSNPREFQRKYPNKRLRVLPRRGGGKVVFEQQKKVVAQRVATREKIRKLKPLFALVPKVRNKPNLKFYRTWDQLEAARRLKWKDRARRMVEDMAEANA